MRRALLLLAAALALTATTAELEALVEVFEIERSARGGAWELLHFATSSGSPVDDEKRTSPPKGWAWKSEWILDGSRGDGAGWEYDGDGGATLPIAGDLRGRGRSYRRRRWLRVLARGRRSVASPATKRKAGANLTEGEARSVTSDFFTAADVKKRAKPPVGLAKRCGRAIGACRDDFTFRGLGLGCSRSVDATSGGLVVQLPLTPNFGFWERRSSYLPMATALVVAYPPSTGLKSPQSLLAPEHKGRQLWEANREAQRVWARTPSNHLVVAFILSVSYPVDALRRIAKAVAAPFAAALPPRRPPAKRRRPSRAVRRVGFSFSSSLTVVADGSAPFRYRRSRVRFRPWLMYAPGIAALYGGARYALGALGAAATRVIHRKPAAAGPPSPAATNATAATTNATANATALAVDAAANATAAAAARSKAAPPSRLRRVELRAAEACLAATAAAKAWLDTKTSLLGFSFLPYQAHLAGDDAGDDADDWRESAFKPWRGSAIFMMRPFYPPRLFPGGKRPPAR